MKQLNQTLTKTLAYGVAAIGVVAGAGMISAPAQALVLYNGCASGTFCTLQELYDGSTIQADDKLFSEFTFQDVNTGNVVAANIIVTGFEDNDTTPEYDPGLLFLDSDQEWDTRRTGPGSIIDYHFSYKVEVTDPGKLITDNYLKEFDADLILPTLPTSNARAEVHEFVFEDSGFTTPALGIDPFDDDNISNEKDVLNEYDSDTGEFVDKNLDKLNFLRGYRELYIFKEVTAQSFGIGPNASYGVINSFEQSFSQTVPEPASILGLAAFGGLGLLSKRKKQK